MSFLPPSAKLTNPTHEVVGPDGTVYLTIRIKGARLRARIHFDAPNWVDITTKGSVSEGWGPSGADAVLMGRWSGILRHHFASAAIDALPDGTYCREINPDPSDYPYQTEIVWSGWEKDSSIAFNRANVRGLPVTRAQRDAARPVMEVHLASLLDGTYRRDDGPMILNDAPPSTGYRPTYVRGEGSPVPADILPEFIDDARHALAYLDFLDTLPDMPIRPRKAA